MADYKIYLKLIPIDFGLLLFLMLKKHLLNMLWLDVRMSVSGKCSIVFEECASSNSGSSDLLATSHSMVHLIIS